MEQNTGTHKAAEWYNNLEKVKEFADTNNRWPSTTASDPDEKSLGLWWSRAKYYYNKYLKEGRASGMDKGRVEAMRQLIESHKNFERDGAWESRLRKVSEKYDRDKRLWSYKTADQEAKKLRRWWDQQRTFYKKFRRGTVQGGMTEKRAEQIEELLEKMGEPLEKQRKSDDEEVIPHDTAQRTAPRTDA